MPGTTGRHGRNRHLAELGEFAKKKTTDISKGLDHSQTPFIINFGKDSPVCGVR